MEKENQMDAQLDLFLKDMDAFGTIVEKMESCVARNREQMHALVEELQSFRESPDWNAFDTKVSALRQQVKSLQQMFKEQTKDIKQELAVTHEAVETLRKEMKENPWGTKEQREKIKQEVLKDLMPEVQKMIHDMFRLETEAGESASL